MFEIARVLEYETHQLVAGTACVALAAISSQVLR